MSEESEGAVEGRDPSLDGVAAPLPRTTDELLPLVYDELRGLARRIARGAGPGDTLQATALVHQAYLKLASRPEGWADRQHFRRVAATAMRQVLADRARELGRAKRGGAWQRVELDGELEREVGSDQVDLLALDEALNELSAAHERSARIVELRFFAGLTIEEAAQALGVSTGTVENDWAAARAWLRRRMAESRAQ